MVGGKVLIFSLSHSRIIDVGKGGKKWGSPWSEWKKHPRASAGWPGPQTKVGPEGEK